MFQLAMYFHLILDSLYHSSFVHGFFIYLKITWDIEIVDNKLLNVKFSKINFEEKVYFKILLSPLSTYEINLLCVFSPYI